MTKWIALCGLSLALPMGHPAYADDAPSTLGTVKVTAQQQGKNSAKIPASIQVIDAITIANANLHDAGDLQDQVANLRIGNEGGRASPSYVSLRGMTNPFGAPESALVMYIDGVPIGDFYSFDQHLFDVQSITVRKGPQGAIYGANSGSGVIDIVTRKPDATLHQFTDVAIASRGGYDTSTGVSGPLHANLYASLAAAADGNDGYINNLDGQRPYNGQSGQNIRGRLVWQASERSEIDAMLLGHRIDDRGGEIYAPVDLATFNQLPSLGGVRLGRFDQAVDHAGGSHANSTLAALKDTWRGDSVQLRATGSWRTNDARNSTDYDLSPQPWFYMDSSYRIHEGNAELRAQSNGGDAARIIWLSGVSLDHRDLNILRIFHAGPGNIWQLPIGAYTRTDAALLGRSVAMFGQATWRFGATQQFGFTAGARAERAQRKIDFGSNQVNEQAAKLGLTDTQLLPKLALDYQLAPAQLLYASAARGWQPGGFNTSAFASVDAQYRPEITTAYEFGLKGKLADGAADYSLAAFRNDIRDYQDMVISEADLESDFANAHRVRTQGVEAVLAWRFAEGWSLGAALGTVHAVYVDYLLDPASGFTLDGHLLQQVPGYNFNTHVQYSVGPWIARVEIAGAGAFAVHDYNATTATLREQDVPDYVTLNTKFGWRAANWSVYVFGRNLTDRRYFTSATFGFAQVALFDGAVGTLAPPRTLGVELRWEH